MRTAGHLCLVIALGLAVYGAIVSVYGARTNRQAWVVSGRRAVYALAGTLGVAFAILETARCRCEPRAGSSARYSEFSFLNFDGHFVTRLSFSATNSPSRS